MLMTSSNFSGEKLSRCRWSSMMMVLSNLSDRSRDSKGDTSESGYLQSKSDWS